MRRKKQTDTEHVRWLLLDIRDDEARRLDALAKQEERPRSSIARLAIREYIAKHLDPQAVQNVAG
jgi:predicted transcriptional regulator